MSKKDLFLELQDPFKDFANKNFCSHKFKQAVYKQSSNLLKEQKEYQAVIMAAGKGSRGKNFFKKPKCLMNFGTKVTLIERTYNILKKYLFF